MARTLFDTRRKFKVKAVGGVETVTYNVADQLSQQLNRYRNHHKTYSQLIFPSTQMAYLFSSLQTNCFGQFHQIERPLHCLFQTEDTNFDPPDKSMVKCVNLRSGYFSYDRSD